MNATATADIPAAVLWSIADALALSLDALSQPPDERTERLAEVHYTAEVLDAVWHKPNPLCTVAGRYPCYALMPDAVAHLVHTWEYGASPRLVGRHDWLAGSVRGLFENAKNRQRPKVANYVSRAGFEQLFTRQTDPAVNAALDEYLRRLKKHVAKSDQLRFELYLVDAPVLDRDVDTRLVWHNLIDVRRSYRTPGVRWSFDPRAVNVTINMLDSLTARGQPEKLTARRLDEYRRQVGG